MIMKYISINNMTHVQKEQEYFKAVNCLHNGNVSFYFSFREESHFSMVYNTLVDGVKDTVTFYIKNWKVKELRRLKDLIQKGIKVVIFIINEEKEKEIPEEVKIGINESKLVVHYFDQGLNFNYNFKDHIKNSLVIFDQKRILADYPANGNTNNIVSFNEKKFIISIEKDFNKILFGKEENNFQKIETKSFLKWLISLFSKKDT